ncbi:MAG: sigma-70 family RNA polymerase sigma factor, partial [Bulleidia sp.]
MENVYELLYMIRTGDTRAFEMLKEECYPIIASMASQMTGKVACYGITRDDLIQEGLICIDISARSYRPDRNAGFKTFLNVMIDRKFKHILRNCHTDKRTEEESMLSLDQYVNAKGQRIERFYAQKDKLSEPEYYLAFMEALEKLKQTIDELSEEDREALREWFR